MISPEKWLDTVQVQGRVTLKSGPLQGVIWFVPNEALIRYSGKDYATIGCWRILDDEGGFLVHLTRGDIPGQEFEYDVYLGTGHWTMRVIPNADGKPVEMATLIENSKEQS